MTFRKNNILANGLFTDIWTQLSLFKTDVSLKMILYFNIPGHDPLSTLMVWFGKVRQWEGLKKNPLKASCQFLHVFCVCASHHPHYIYNLNEDAFSRPELASLYIWGTFRRLTDTLIYGAFSSKFNLLRTCVHKFASIPIIIQSFIHFTQPTDQALCWELYFFK